MKIRNFILNLFFPKKCLGCGKSDTYLCTDCFKKIKILLNNECFFCGKITWQGKICLPHKPDVYLDRIISATNYADPLVRELIKSFKYHFVQELAEPLSQLLIRVLQDLNFSAQGGPASGWQSSNFQFLIIPIPLHKHRLRYRGFNQAELLAKKIAEHFNLSMNNDVLKRVIATDPQAKFGTDYEKRKANLKNIFTVDNEQGRRNLIADKIIILIDDVATTGTTLIEAAKILKLNGAKEVWAVTVAKG